MSLCQLCKFKIKLLFYCSLCRNQFCSCNCLIKHISINHSNKIITGKNYTILNPNDNLTKSSFNTQGYIINMKPYKLTKEEFNLFEIIKNKNNECQLGSGAFSKVYLGKHIPTEELYAIKKLSKKELKTKIDSIEIIKREIELHSKLYHKNIIHLVGTYENEENIFIILEYSNKGDLFKLIRKKKIIDEQTCFNYFIQTVNSVLFLHENNLIHRDIKPENILINDNNEIKLCDFGCCVESAIGNRTTFCGTYEYMAPEIIKETSYNNSVDVWSLGILLYELSHGYSPFNMNYNGKKTQENVFKDIIRNNFDFKKGMNFISEEYNELMIRMIVYNPNKRIKLRDVFKSKLIVKFENKKYIEERKSIYNSKKNNNKDKNIGNNKHKILSERQDSIHLKHPSYKEIILTDRNSKNERNSDIRKSNTTKFEREDSLYTQLKKNKKIDLNSNKKIHNSNKKINNSYQKQKSNKQLYKINPNYDTKYQCINLCDINLEDDSNKSDIKKSNSIKLTKNYRRRERAFSTSSSMNQMNIANNFNNSNNLQNNFQNGLLKSNYKFHNHDNNLFNQIFPNENNDEEMRKTKMRNVNGVDISSKLMDVLDIFKRVEKFQKANENLSLFEQLFSSK